MRTPTLAVLAALYLFALLWADPRLRPGGLPPPQPRPLRPPSLACWHCGSRSFVLNVIGNLVLFVPLGIFVPLSSDGPSGSSPDGRDRRTRPEPCDRVVPVRLRPPHADVDDLLLNTAGSVLGLWTLPPPDFS